MAGWHSRIARAANYVERYFDAAKSRIGKAFRKANPIKIIAYRTFGTKEIVHLKGRVLIDKGIRTDETDGRWKNLVNTFKRFNSDEVPNAKLRARIRETSTTLTTDQEGFFEEDIKLAEALPADRLWHEVQFELVEAPEFGNPQATERGFVLIPPPKAMFSVISDMDDTVIQTDAASMMRMVRTILFGSARTRLPFKGVASFYRALQRGGNEVNNPLFYVSSSPWNLYDLLMDFFTIQGIPEGPLFLRDWGVSENEVLPMDHRTHKLTTIRHIMDTINDLPFILIGDSGQADPEIYSEIVQLYPGRILAVYIRDVSRLRTRSDAIRKLAQKVEESGSTLVLADDTTAAAQHAIQRGWISAQDYIVE
jgi:phosphatidate phosphatase APP1